MYEDLMGMDGLGALSLESLKAAAPRYAVLGISTVASAYVAKMVANKIATAEFAKDKAWVSDYAAPAVPLVVGLGIGAYGVAAMPGESMARSAIDGVALGMVAFGIAGLLTNVAAVKDYMPFANFKGLGATDLSISSYLKGAPSRIEGLGAADPFSATAQLQRMGFRGLGAAPSRVEMNGLGAAPSQVETEQHALQGLAATLM